ncbi:nitroreductase family protein [Methanonatronarchaeum thermophilum]|nr:nitroreductase family protein [Methanonatronarchaeum thermophilum]
MDLVDAVFRRKSTRNYTDDVVDVGKVDSLLSGTHSLLGVDVAVLVVDGSDLHDEMDGVVGDYGKVVAPRYFVLVSEEGDWGAVASGYFGEKLVLELTKHGVASCWVGEFGDRDNISDFLGCGDRVIHALIAYGAPEGGSVYREAGAASRKDISELIIDGDSYLSRWREVLDVVKYAPSSINSQPWRFVLKEKQIDLYIKVGGLKKKILGLVGDIQRLNLIDSGIALKHLEVGMDNPKIVRLDLERDLEKFRYIASVVEKN